MGLDRVARPIQNLSQYIEATYGGDGNARGGGTSVCSSKQAGADKGKNTSQKSTADDAEVLVES